MKKRMRFLAVAALSLAMTTAFGQTGTQGSSGSSGSSGSGVSQQDQSGQGSQSGQSGVQSGQSGQGSSGSYGTGSQSGTQSGTRQGQTGQGSQSQGMGSGSAEARVKSEVQWMKTQFNLTDSQEQRLHDVLLKYESQSSKSSGDDATKNKDEKEKEIKAIIGEDNYKVYKQKKSDTDKSSSPSGQGSRQPDDRMGTTSGSQSSSTGTYGSGSQSGSSGTTRQGQSGQGSSSGTYGSGTSTQSGQGSSGSSTRQGSTGTQSQGSSGTYGSGSQTQGGTSTRQGSTGTQSGQGSQGMGVGSVSSEVSSDIQWMKSEFNLTDAQEQRLQQVLMKYEGMGARADESKNKDEKEKEIKAIIGEDNFKVYKEKQKDKDKNKSGSGSSTKQTR